MAKIGVVLSGCGVNDGSEIHEAVITMLELDKAGAEMVLMAPNIDQLHVINHATGEEMDDSRNVLCLLYTSPSPRDLSTSRMPSSA